MYVHRHKGCGLCMVKSVPCSVLNFEPIAKIAQSDGPAGCCTICYKMCDVVYLDHLIADPKIMLIFLHL